VPRPLIVVGGPPGVGKTAVCRALLDGLPGNTAWLDGDWCWTMHPFRVTEENKWMVQDNIAHVLRSFLQNTSFDQVVFCWVLHQREILDDLLQRLDGLDYDLRWYSLTAEPSALRDRMLGDGRSPAAVEASAARLPLYPALPSRLVDTTGRSVGEVVEEIMLDFASRPSKTSGVLP
jgi:broad-specificity NMP kinase